MHYYTAQQIVTDACMIAKCPGMTSLGGRSLNLVLDDLSLHRNLKVNLVTGTITATAGSTGPFTLESAYLRTYDLFFYVTGYPFFLNQCSLKESDAEVQGLMEQYPYEFATDLSPQATGNPGLLYIYPSNSTTLALTHRYYLEQPVIVTPETSSTVPWFEDVDYLVTATAARLMRITDDTRYDKYMQDCDRLLEKHLMTEGDEQQVVKEVQLDPRRFKAGGGNRPTKLQPW